MCLLFVDVNGDGPGACGQGGSETGSTLSVMWFSTRRQRSRCGTRGIRVGEANHLGPEKVFETLVDSLEFDLIREDSEVEVVAPTQWGGVLCRPPEFMTGSNNIAEEQDGVVVMSGSDTESQIIGEYEDPPRRRRRLRLNWAAEDEQVPDSHDERLARIRRHMQQDRIVEGRQVRAVIGLVENLVRRIGSWNIEDGVLQEIHNILLMWAAASGGHECAVLQWLTRATKEHRRCGHSWCSGVGSRCRTRSMESVAGLLTFIGSRAGISDVQIRSAFLWSRAGENLQIWQSSLTPEWQEAVYIRVSVKESCQ